MNNKTEFTKTVRGNTENVLLFKAIEDENGQIAFKCFKVDQWLDYGICKNPIVKGVVLAEQYMLLWPDTFTWECHGDTHQGNVDEFYQSLNGLEA